MGILVYSSQWVMQDFVHQPYACKDLDLLPRQCRGRDVWWDACKSIRSQASGLAAADKQAAQECTLPVPSCLPRGQTMPPAFDVLKIVLALLPAFAVGLAVFRQSKLVAAFAQLNDLQERGERQQALAKKAIEVDKEWFMIGVTNMVLSAYIVGRFPALYFVYFTPKVLSLIGLRLVKFYRRKQHFLLWDFCYWANFLCIFYCWVMPKSPRVFRVVFMCANGPLAWSVLAFNHAMVFHSYAHMTSVVVHVSPLLLSYGLRWSAAPVSEDSIGSHHFRVCESQETCNDISVTELICKALAYFVGPFSPVVGCGLCSFSSIFVRISKHLCFLLTCASSLRPFSWSGRL